MRRTRKRMIAAVGAGVLAAGLATGSAAAAGAPKDGADVPGCGDSCSKAFDYDIGNGYTLEGLHTPAGPASEGFIATRHDDRLVSSMQLDRLRPNGIEHLDGSQCVREGARATCVIAGQYGTYSETVLALRVSNTDGSITVTDSVLHSTSSYSISDLVGDGIPDVTMVESTFDPTHATAPRYQLTYLLQAGKFHLTGCTAPSKDSQPMPTAPLNGVCFA